MTGFFIAIAVALVALIYGYNKAVVLKNYVSEGFATMDVYLKKRWDLIPNLVETVKGYSKHESSVLEEVVKLRNSSYDALSLSEKLNTNEQLSNHLSKLIAVAESYPDLKASQNFLSLSNDLSQIEDEIAQSRKYYNAVVRKFNTKVEMFPSNIIANCFHFTTLKMFEAGEAERANVKVDLS